jgi:hypothetical protein
MNADMARVTEFLSRERPVQAGRARAFGYSLRTRLHEASPNYVFMQPVESYLDVFRYAFVLRPFGAALEKRLPMFSQSLVIGAILSFVASLSVAICRALQKREPRSDAPASVGPNEDVRVVLLSSSLRAHIFQRPGGSFGYYYTRRVELDDEFDSLGHPYWSNIGGPGSVFDSADRAEEHACRAAIDET